MIIDSHCHLDYPDLYEKLDQVIIRAKNNNVRLLLSICTTLDSFERIKLIIKKYKFVYGTFGIHPHETQKYQNVNNKYIVDVKKSNKKIIGIGETGLDFYYNHSDKKIQKRSFIEHIRSAADLKIPLIVHSRNAEKETYEILKEEMKNLDLKVLIHCFTGSANFAKKLIDINCFISVSGIITFKNSADLEKTVSNIPVENLLLETDSPFLAPSPYRGKINEPSYIIHTLKKLSQIKNKSTEFIMDNTSKNFKKLFNVYEI